MVTSIIKGPDENMWYSASTRSTIGKITPAGTITEYAVDPTFAPGRMTAGPDGNVWFFAGGFHIGKITPDGSTTFYPAGVGQGGIFGPGLIGITAGPDGNIWYTANDTGMVAKMTPSGQVTAYPLPGAGGRTSVAPFPRDITAGPDGNVWFVQSPLQLVSKMTPNGDLTQSSVGASPMFITAGPDGNLWFTADVSPPRIGRITPAGQPTLFRLTGTDLPPQAFALGPDGNFWFTVVRQIGTFTLSGQTFLYSPPDLGGALPSIAAGPDGNVWIVEQDRDRIGRFTPPPTPRDFLPVMFFDWSGG